MYQPIAGRVGHVGGIETLVLDGHLYFFGFDYSSDLVVSPLIDNIDAMAQFASLYMEQRDGRHDAAYWHSLAQDSIDDSSLCSNLASRTFNTEKLAATTNAIGQAAQNGNVINGLEIEYHLLYLLAAAGGWEGPSVDDIGELILLLSDQETLPSDQTLSGVAIELRDSLRQLLSAAPESWATRFASLQSV